MYAMDIIEKLEILADAAKYDVACTSSGVNRSGKKGQLGAAGISGCCHSFTPDGRCISLLKVLMTNVCIYDCAYCVNRCSNSSITRTAFTPRELADLVIGFYRRNYIEGLFLSSGVIGSPDNTTELMIRALNILREEYGFRGYIHTKTVPGTSPELIDLLGSFSDRLSVNIEFPSSKSLELLAPEKSKDSILLPMKQISDNIVEDHESNSLRRSKKTFYLRNKRARSVARSFAPAGQSTQMIIGATPETDHHILNLSSSLYRSFSLKRVFFSAYIPMNQDDRLPLNDAIQLDREHRLYQADWLMRSYQFSVDEIIDIKEPFLATDIDPKANWAINNLDLFPVEINTASFDELIRVPGIGVKGAKLIIKARKSTPLYGKELRKLGVAYKRARYFITCSGSYEGTGVSFDKESLHHVLSAPINGGKHGRRADRGIDGQLSLFDSIVNVEKIQLKRLSKSGEPLLGSSRIRNEMEIEHPSSGSLSLLRNTEF